MFLDGDEAISLWEGGAATGATWDDGEAICRRLRLRLPLEATPGDYSLSVASGGSTIALGDVTVAESTRQFALPPVETESGMTYGDQIQLAGFDRAIDESGELAVTLVWQALRQPDDNYQVFVHLLDENGQIVAQSDAAPGDGYATGQWLAGEVVVDTHTLALPESTDLSTMKLRVGLYEPLSGQRLTAVDRDGQQAPDDAAVLQP